MACCWATEEDKGFAKSLTNNKMGKAPSTPEETWVEYAMQFLLTGTAQDFLAEVKLQREEHSQPPVPTSIEELAECLRPMFVKTGSNKELAFDRLQVEPGAVQGRIQHWTGHCKAVAGGAAGTVALLNGLAMKIFAFAALSRLCPFPCSPSVSRQGEAALDPLQSFSLPRA